MKVNTPTSDQAATNVLASPPQMEGAMQQRGALKRSALTPPSRPMKTVWKRAKTLDCGIDDDDNDSSEIDWSIRSREQRAIRRPMSSNLLLPDLPGIDAGVDGHDDLPRCSLPMMRRSCFRPVLPLVTAPKRRNPPSPLSIADFPKEQVCVSVPSFNLFH